MALRKLKDRFNRRQAERVFLEAQRALLAPQKADPVQGVAYVVSALILLLPVMLCLGSLWLIAATWVNIPAIIVGLIGLAVSYLLFPRYPRNEDKTYRRADLPQLYVLLDAIADGMGTRVPDGVHLIEDVNAYAGNYGLRRNERIIGIGIPLWRALTPQERIAVLAHEMAHFVNNDPARGSLTGAALQTVERWDYLLASDFHDGEYRDWYDIIGEIAQWLLRLPISLLGFVLMLLQFNRMQRAEYLADGYAAQVSGSEAMIGTINKLVLTPLTEKALLGLYPYRKDQNASVFDVMAGAIVDAHPEDVRLLQERAAEKMQRVDDSHPPNVYRVGFLQALGDMPGSLQAADVDFDAIDAELGAESDRLGKRLMQMLEDSTM